jgi:hypothetical protein
MIGSHTIPAFYLQQFANKSSLGKKHGLIWVYEKGKAPAERSIRVQGKQKGYFAVLQNDKSMSDQSSEAAITALENDCNDALFCAKSELFDWSSSTHRRKLAFYVAFLYSRATQRRAHSEKVGLSVYEELEKAAGDDELMQELSESVNAAAKQTLFTADMMRNSVLKTIAEGRTQQSANTHFVSNLRDLTEYLAGLLLQKHWQAWRAPDGMEFVTSDNPVMNFVRLSHGPFHPGHGFNRPGALTAFPLSPHACLIIGVLPGYPEIYKVDPETVRRTNEAMIGICDRYVYSKNLSEETDGIVQQFGGDFKYGVNALMPVGLKLPSARAFLRYRFGLDPDT